MGMYAWLVTDVQGSTRRWVDDPRNMAAVIDRHDLLVRQVATACGGDVVPERAEGDSSFVVFGPGPRCLEQALAAAVALQRALAAQRWPGGESLQVRMAVHGGVVGAGQDPTQWNPQARHAAALRAAAHGGQILLSAAAARTPAPASTTVVPRGRHHLADGPTEVAELCWSGAVDPRPLRQPADSSVAFPADDGRLIDRSAERAALAALLSTGGLVTVTGPGGVGKSALALRVAADAATRRGGRRVNLAGCRPHEVPGSIDAVLGVAGQGVPASVGGSRQVLLLDDVDPVAPVVAELAVEMTAVAPGLALLVTSRHPLGVPGERCYALGGLDVPAADDPAAVLASAAGQLFFERALEAQPGLALDVRTSPVVAEICRRLAGHPLSLELAAARLSVVSPAQLLARLADPDRILAAGPRRLLERHRSVRECLAWPGSRAHTLSDVGV